MDNTDEDKFVDNHVKQVRMSRKTGRHVNHVHFQYHLHDIAKEKIEKRKKKGYGRKKSDKRKRKKSHRGYFRKPKHQTKRKKIRKQKNLDLKLMMWKFGNKVMKL